jgi:RNA polymerase sigma-70 factor, ECF subfamily
MTVETCTKWLKRQANMTNPEVDDIGLIKRAKSDSDAFAQLYLMHYDNVFRYCICRLFERHLAEDVTSTVFFKVMHNLSSFDGTAVDFRNWIFRIATNAVNDYLRDTKRRTDIIRKTVINSHTQSVFVLDCNEDLLKKKAFLKQAVLSLKPMYQTVITLHFFENMKLTEIAVCLGKNPSTVRTWLERATEKLRKKLEAAIGKGGQSL